jgi:YggT family protein
MRWVMPFVNVVLMILSFIEWIVIIWVVISWIVFFASQTSFRWRNRGLYNLLSQINNLLSRMAYPFILPFRRILPPHKMGGIDWSPLLLLLAIFLIRQLILVAVT